MIQAEVSIIGIKGIPEIKSGALLHDIIVRAIKRQNITLSNGDLLVVDRQEEAMFKFDDIAFRIVK